MIPYRHILVIMAFVLVASADAEPSRPAVYVDAGDNLLEAIRRAPRETLIVVRPGDYAGGTIRSDGVAIQSEEQGTVRITSPVRLRASNVTLEGLLWENMDGHLIEVYGRANQIRKCTFRGFGKKKPSKAIWIRETGDHGDNVIEDCLFEDWGGLSYHSSAVKISQQGHGDAFSGTIVRRNTIRNFAVGGNNPGIQPFAPSLIENNVIHDGEDGVEVKGSRMVVRGNTVYNMRGSEAMSNRSGSDNLFEANTLYNIHTYAWQIWTGGRNVWRNNVVHGCNRIAHIKGGDSRDAAAVDVLLINNTFYQNDRGVSWDLKRFPPRDVRFYNNIFVGDGSSEIESAGDGLYKEDSNLFYQFDAPRLPGSRSIVGANPEFTSPEENDFRLRRSSPARDAGASFKESPTTDKDGRPRPQGATIDMGAYEFSSEEK